MKRAFCKLSDGVICFCFFGAFPDADTGSGPVGTEWPFECHCIHILHIIPYYLLYCTGGKPGDGTRQPREKHREEHDG